jgi:hypothetical protein
VILSAAARPFGAESKGKRLPRSLRLRQQARGGLLRTRLGITVDRLRTIALLALTLPPWLACEEAAAQTTAPVAPGTRAAVTPVEREMAAKVIVDDLAGPVRLAASPTGQTLYALPLEARDVLGIDLEDPAKRWTAVPASPGGVPKAVGVIDSSTLALVVREDESWSIRVHRLPAPGTPGTAEPAQSVKLGSSEDSGGEPRIVVSPARDWLAVTGLPAPLPKILRLTVTGARLGPPSERRCPPLADRPQAVTVGAGGEWGLFLPAAADAAGKSSVFAWVSPSGAQRLLQTDSGLERVIDAACCRETGLLWALAGGAIGGGTEGLWRIDAAYVEGRQIARPVSIKALASPTALVCLPNGEVAVANGTERSHIVRFTPRDGGTKEPDR